ncbi:MAG: cupin domain-containing protein [Synergistaceae bacterium]|nr:cupin domain-containing protein [Synergistaceae bacterium]
MALIKQDEKPEITANLRGGIGEARIFASPIPPSCGPLTFASRIELAPGASIGLHRHDDDEEVYAVISGEGVYIYDGDECPARAGDTFTKKGNVPRTEKLRRRAAHIFRGGSKIII